MFGDSRKVASALLLGFVGANVFAWACLVAEPVSPSIAGTMTHCDMVNPDAGGSAVGAFYDCCLTCVADAGLLNTHGFQVPPGVPALSRFDASFQDIALPALREQAERPVPPEISPPVFLLNGSLLI